MAAFQDAHRRDGGASGASRSQEKSRPAAEDCGLVYLDNAATTKPLGSVCDAVSAAMREVFGNPSSAHSEGRRARAILEESRRIVAEAIGSDPDEVVFTSGGTESNNLAVMGTCGAYARKRGFGTIVTSALEHPSVTKSVRAMRREGWGVEYLDAVGGDLDLGRLERVVAERGDVALVSVMAVQSELGYAFPVSDVASVCKSAHPSPVVHTDAVQAFGKLETNVRRSGVDLMSLCAHKIGGPKGIGALYVRRGTGLFTTAAGGGQEGGLRSGTQAVPLIAGFAEAVRAARSRQGTSFARACRLRALLLGGLRESFPQLVVNSREDGSPFIVNFSLPGTDNRAVIERLDGRGVCISATMACASSHETVAPGTWREKHPLPLQLAGVPKSLAGSTYRVSFGPQSTEEDVARLLGALREAALE